MHEAYDAKGLTILSATGESKDVVQPFVDQLAPVYPILCQAGGQVSQYSTGGVPSAYLIGADGKVLWQGHPNELSDSDLEAHLKAVAKEHRVSSWGFLLAQKLPPVPEKISGVRKALEDLKFGAALKTVEGALAKFEGEEKAQAEALREWIAARGTRGMEKAATLLREGRPYPAAQAYEEVQSLYKGHDLAKQADEAVKALKKDKAHALEIKAGETLTKIKKEMAQARNAEDRLECLKPLLAKKYAETQAGKEAATLAAELEKSAKAR